MMDHRANRETEVSSIHKVDIARKIFISLTEWQMGALLAYISWNMQLNLYGKHRYKCQYYGISDKVLFFFNLWTLFL